MSDEKIHKPIISIEKFFIIMVFFSTISALIALISVQIVNSVNINFFQLWCTLYLFCTIVWVGFNFIEKIQKQILILIPFYFALLSVGISFCYFVQNINIEPVTPVLLFIVIGYKLIYGIPLK